MDEINQIRVTSDALLKKNRLGLLARKLSL